MKHIDSYYAQTAPNNQSFAPLDRAHKADVCVIGGGLAGLSTALELLRHGKSVVLLEANQIGWGASGRNGGFVSDGYALGIDAIEQKLGFDHAKSLYDISVEGTNFVRQNIQNFGDPSIIMGKHWLNVVRHDTGDALKKSVAQRVEKYGADLEFFTIEKTRAHLKSERYFQGIEDKNAFHIHPLKYARALAQEIIKKGGRIFTGTRATAILRHQSGATIETNLGHNIEAAKIVLCGSAYMRGLFPKVESAVLPVATYVVTSTPMEEQLKTAIDYRGAIADTRRAGDYYRLVDDGQRLLWGGRITTQRGEPKKLAQMLAKDIEAVYPQLKGIKIDKAWAGLMGYCVHKMPLLREVEPNIWVATATGGHGLNTTAALGIVTAEAVAGASDRYKLFSPFKSIWGGGPIGRVATQLAYWQMQMADWLDERR